MPPETTSKLAVTSVSHFTQILEKSAFLKETGAAVHLPPNCTALLRWMGIDPADFGGTLLHEVRFAPWSEKWFILIVCTSPDPPIWI